MRSRSMASSRLIEADLRVVSFFGSWPSFDASRYRASSVAAPFEIGKLAFLASCPQ